MHPLATTVDEAIAACSAEEPLAARISQITRHESKHRVEVREAFQKFPGTLRDAVNQLFDLANQLLRLNGRGELLVIIDNLDRYPPGVVDKLLLQEADRIDELRCNLILTPPISLHYRPTSISLGERYDCQMMPAVRLRDRGDPYGTLKQLGRDLLLKALGKRIHLNLIPDPAAQERLVIASGGAMRDLLKLVANAALRSDGDIITRSAVETRVPWVLFLHPARAMALRNLAPDFCDFATLWLREEPAERAAEVAERSVPPIRPSFSFEDPRLSEVVRLAETRAAHEARDALARYDLAGGPTGIDRARAEAAILLAEGRLRDRSHPTPPGWNSSHPRRSGPGDRYPPRRGPPGLRGPGCDPRSDRDRPAARPLAGRPREERGSPPGPPAPALGARGSRALEAAADRRRVRPAPEEGRSGLSVGALALRDRRVDSAP